MPDPTFTITIKGVNKDLTFPVIFEVNWGDFKRFKIVAKNGSLTFEKHMPKNGEHYWRVIGRLPKSEAGKLQLQYMQDELESYLRNIRYDRK